MKNLLVVESPLKARTVWSALNAAEPESWVVLDYPTPPTFFPRKLFGGINSAGGFEPMLSAADPDKLSRILEMSKTSDAVYLCFDPTLGGEETSVYLLNAISAHVDFSKIHRIRFGFLTKKSIQKAVAKTAGFDNFSAEKSENLRLLDRMVEFNVHTALGGKAIYDSDIGLCSYYIMSLLTGRYAERRRYSQKLPEFRVAFKADNGALIRSSDSYFQSGATTVAELCLKWLGDVHRIGNVTGEDVVIPPPQLHDVNTLLLECVKSADVRIESFVDNIVGMYHEGLVTNPYADHKVSRAYSESMLEYLKSFELMPLKTADEAPQLHGIVPIDIRLDINKIKKSYRPIYRKLWQRTVQAYGTETRLRKTVVKFMVGDGKTAGGDGFSGTYFDVLDSGHMEFFNKIRRDTIPDNLREVVLEKLPSGEPQHYTEPEIVERLLPVFSAFEVSKAIGELKAAKFLRTGTNTLFIPTFRGLILSFAVLKHVPQLGQLDWITSMLSKVSQPRNTARQSLADAWDELKPMIKGLDRHKFVCEQPCSACGSSLTVVFDKDREPYVLCQKTDAGGCGTVQSVSVTDSGNIVVFEPYAIIRPCPKCELPNMRCHNGPYGLFIRCDSCGKTHPFE